MIIKNYLLLLYPHHKFKEFQSNGNKLLIASDICDLRGNLLKEAPVGFNFENVLKALLVLSKAVNLDLQMQPKKTVVKYPHKWGKLNVGTTAQASAQTLLVIQIIHRWRKSITK